jgi:hypothetical protein
VVGCAYHFAVSSTRHYEAPRSNINSFSDVGAQGQSADRFLRHEPDRFALPPQANLASVRPR